VEQEMLVQQDRKVSSDQQDRKVESVTLAQPDHKDQLVHKVQQEM